MTSRETRCDPLRFYALSHADDVCSRSLEVKLCASWYSNSEIFRVIWIYEMFISGSGMEHVSSSLFTSAPRPQLLTYSTCFRVIFAMVIWISNPPTDQHHPIITDVINLDLQVAFVFNMVISQTSLLLTSQTSLLCRRQEWDSFQILEDGSGRAQRLMHVGSGQRVFRSCMTHLMLRLRLSA